MFRRKPAGPARRKQKRKFMLILVVLVVLTVAGYHYRDYLLACGEDWPLPGSGEVEPPPPVEEPEAEEPEAEEPYAAGPEETGPGGDVNPSPYPPPPGEILHIADGDYLLALVTKQTTLGKYAPDDLVTVPAEMNFHPETLYRLRKEAYEHLRKMWEAARADEITLTINSAYRCYETQQNLFDLNVARKDGDEEEANKVSARPGQSEHQLGTTVDFARPGAYLCPTFAETPDGRWLAENAPGYGFALSYPEGATEITGYSYEPWHYRYIGVANALAWKESGLVLSQFLAGQPQSWLNLNN